MLKKLFVLFIFTKQSIPHYLFAIFQIQYINVHFHMNRTLQREQLNFISQDTIETFQDFLQNRQ